MTTRHGHNRKRRESPTGRPFGYGRTETGGLTAREREVLAQIGVEDLGTRGRMAWIGRNLGIDRRQVFQIVARLRKAGLVTPGGMVSKKGREVLSTENDDRGAADGLQ